WYSELYGPLRDEALSDAILALPAPHLFGKCPIRVTTNSSSPKSGSGDIPCGLCDPPRSGKPIEQDCGSRLADASAAPDGKNEELCDDVSCFSGFVEATLGDERKASQTTIAPNQECEAPSLRPIPAQALISEQAVLADVSLGGGARFEEVE